LKIKEKPRAFVKNLQRVGGREVIKWLRRRGDQKGSFPEGAGNGVD
jgi:hypothetical protein